MRNESNAEENFTVGLDASPPWRLRSVRPLPGFRLDVEFVDGTRGEVDMSQLIAGPNAGVFASLRDESLFTRIAIQHGAASWPGEIDLAPDAMYDAIKGTGRWTVIEGASSHGSKPAATLIANSG